MWLSAHHSVTPRRRLLEGDDEIIRNDDVDWDRFDPDQYVADNYAQVRDDDREIVDRVRDFFGSVLTPDRSSRGIDVGTGPNLYPSLAMLPFCAEIDLWEYSSGNVRWLKNQTEDFGTGWNEFWKAYRIHPAYATIDGEQVRPLYRSTVDAVQRSIFDLPSSKWDVGTMFFVACSISGRRHEFSNAVQRFVGSLRPAAPFAAAFMTQSQGYDVAGRPFPAVSVDRSAVATAFQDRADHLDLVDIHSHVPVRPGVGMVLATGFAR